MGQIFDAWFRWRAFLNRFLREVRIERRWKGFGAIMESWSAGRDPAGTGESCGDGKWQIADGKQPAKSEPSYLVSYTGEADFGYRAAARSGQVAGESIE